MRRSAVIGGILWTGLAVSSVSRFHPLGTIELLFLLAPLVVVPLGLEFSRRFGKGRAIDAAVSEGEWLQLPSALCVAASFGFAPGWAATVLTLPWFGFGCFLSFCGAHLARGGFRSLREACPVVAFGYIGVGCIWLVASRGGLTPMGFQEPIVLLTAIHFHYAGFAAPLLTQAAATALGGARVAAQRLFQLVAKGVLAGPGLLAAGFVIGPRLKLAAALLLAGSEIGLAIFFLSVVRAMRPRLAQALVTLSAASLLFAMALAGVWAIGEFPLQPFVHLAEMARFHGTANALGFTVCGLLGWTLSARGAVAGKGVAE
ncbi:MAG: YndJ family transporter [Candidatus Acidiferrales bacterium]